MSGVKFAYRDQEGVAAPAAGYLTLFANADGQLVTKDSDGVVAQVGVTETVTSGGSLLDAGYTLTGPVLVGRVRGEEGAIEALNPADVAALVAPHISAVGGSAAWGDITGTLSAQTDLNSALAGKQPLATVLTNTTAAFTTAQETKLAGIATAATANDTDANLKNRANHTGTQAASTISDFTEASQDVVGAMVAAAGGSYDDAAGTITLPGGSGTLSEINAGLGKNLFDENATLPEFETDYSNGALSPASTSEVSAPIYVRGLSHVTISGLPVNTAGGNNYSRFWSFLGLDQETVISFGFVAYDVTTHTLAVPANAYFVRYDLSRRNGAGLDYGDVQVESGTEATAFEAYQPGIVGFGEKLVKVPTVPAAPYAGRSIALIGDSITETTHVDAGSYTYGTGYRNNWPDHVIPSLEASKVRTYAKSGAHFADAAGLTSNQKMSTQVTNVRNQYTADGGIDLCIIALGTNDWGNSATSGGGSIVLGTAATALAKGYSDLDMTISADALVKNLHNLRYYCPEMPLLGLTPIQRGDFNPTAGMGAWVEEIRKIYQAFAVPVVDCFYGSGIVYRFETVSGAGLDLSDRLHPNAAGQQKQGRFILPYVQAALTV